MDDGTFAEAIEGLSMPVKFSAPISSVTMNKGLAYLKDYQPIAVTFNENDSMEVAEDMMNKEIDTSITDIFNETNIREQLIDIKAKEHYLKVQQGTPIEQVVQEIASLEWSEAIRIISKISHLVKNEEKHRE